MKRQSDAGQSFVCEKSPAMPIEAKESAALPRFVRVKVCFFRSPDPTNKKREFTLRRDCPFILVFPEIYSDRPRSGGPLLNVGVNVAHANRNCVCGAYPGGVQQGT